MTFDSFVRAVGPRLRAGLVASYGPETGQDAAAAALAYGWEHWDRVSKMDNAAGYLFRVGQTEARRTFRKPRFLPVPEPEQLSPFEPGLVPALEALTESQRTAVVLVHGFGWPQVEVAELLDVSTSTLRTHLSRGLKKLQDDLEVDRV